jgi:hypothetical protein
MKEVQLENTEEALKVKGTMMNKEAEIDPDKFQTIVLNHPPKGTVEEVIGWPEGYSETLLGTTGTSSQPSLKKDKQQVTRSLRKKPVATIILPHITDGVRVESGLLR